MESEISRQKVEGENHLQARLDKHPLLKARVEGLLNLVEGIDDVRLADDAERKVVEELRSMGNELLTNWGEAQAARTAAEACEQGAVKHVKKTSLAQHLR